MSRDLTPAERHTARQTALQMLYQWELSGSDLGEVAVTYRMIEPGTVDADVCHLAENLVRGTATSLDRIDPLITEQAQNWRIERMPVVDRLILRLAIFELLESDTPRAVIIDEALELAKTFSSDAAVKFVNGLLDAIAQRVRPGERLRPHDHVD